MSNRNSVRRRRNHFKEFSAVVEDVVDDCLIDDAQQEVSLDHPLIMFDYPPSRAFEQHGAGRILSRELLDRPVMKADERKVHLRDGKVLTVPF
jgi:hypothetical protein